MIKKNGFVIFAVICMMALCLIITDSAYAGLRRIVNGATSKPGTFATKQESNSKDNMVVPRGTEAKLAPIDLKGVKLKGTAVTGIFKSIAIVEDTLTQVNYWYKVGDTLCGARIAEIRRGELVLEIDGRRYLFGLPEGSAESASGEILTASAAGDRRQDITLGKMTGDNKWEVKLNDAITMLTQAGKIMKEARIRPYFAVGKAAGIRVDRIKDESIIREMGIEDGDVVKGVNGFELMSPKTIFEAYRKYKNRSLIELQLLRNDRPVTLTYNIVR